MHLKRRELIFLPIELDRGKFEIGFAKLEVESKGPVSGRFAVIPRQRIAAGERAQPRGILTAARCGDPITIFREIKRWDEVMMHIDQTKLRDNFCVCKR